MATVAPPQHDRGGESHQEAHGGVREAVQGSAIARKLRHNELLRIQQDPEEARQGHRVSVGGGARASSAVLFFSSATKLS